MYVSNLPSLGDGYWASARRSTLRAHYVYRTRANDPAQALDLVADAEEMAFLGPEMIDRTKTTHYRAT